MSAILDCLPTLLEGLWLSARVWFITVLFAVPLALTFAVGKVSGPKLIRKLVGFYTWFWRGTPLMLQLFFMYFAMPYLGFSPSPFLAATLTFICNSTAYHTEIFRSGIESIDRGQYEAAKVLGMTCRHTMLRIILPQITRRVLPATCNEFILIFKDTALLAAVAMGDLLRQTQELFNRNYHTSPYIVALALYLLIAWTIIRAFRTLEKKLAVME